MATNYQVSEIAGAYAVMEKHTEQIIEVYFDQQEAKKYMKFLNLGGAFDGLTPNFMLRKPLSSINKTSKNM
jgi:hypothetical protein